MAVSRSQRTYPLVLKNDPLNVGIVSAFDWASEDASTNASNGIDHSGNGRNFTVAASVPLIVETAVGKGRDTSRGKTTRDSGYTASHPGIIGMAVGTGDFTVYKKIRTPSSAPVTSAMRAIGRLADSAGSKYTYYMYEVPSTGGWHWMAGGLLWNTSGNPALAPNTITTLHVTRSAGTVKVFVDGVLLKTTAGSTTDLLGTGGASKTIVGNFNSGDEHVDFVAIDDIYWNRALTDAEVVAHAANPYSYYNNTAPADTVTITSPADGATVGTNITISGTITGGGAPGAIEASFNGGAWTVIDAAPTASSFSGILANQSLGTGTLSVRWKNNTAITDTATGINVVSASITFQGRQKNADDITRAMPYRMFQRDASNNGTVRLKGTYTGTPTAIEYRWKGGTWTTLDAAPAGGVFDKTVTLTGVGQGALEVRFANNTSVAASMPAVGVGDVFIVGGQSNHVGMSPAYVSPQAPASNPTWISVQLNKDGVWRQHHDTQANRFDMNTDADAEYPVQTYDSPGLGSYFGALATKIMAGGVPVAFVACALGSTGISAWGVSTSTNSLYGAMLARANEIGAHKAVLWWQGEYEAGAGGYTQAQYVSALNEIINDWFTRTGRKWFITAINEGQRAYYAEISAAIKEVGQTNPNVQGYCDMYGAFDLSASHYETVGEVNEVATRAFAPMNAAYSYVGAAPDTTAPSFAGTVTVSAVTATSATLTWPAATDDRAVTGYEYSLNGGTSYTANGASLSANLTGLTSATTYAVRVRAYDAAGNKSAPLSATLTTSSDQTGPDTAPPTLTGIIVVSGITSSTFNVSCDAATDNVSVAGYELSVDTGTASYSGIGNTPNYYVTGLLPSTQYTVRIRAYDAAGNRSTALTKTATTTAQLTEVVVPEYSKDSAEVLAIPVVLLSATPTPLLYKSFLSQELVLYNKSGSSVVVTVKGSTAGAYKVPKAGGKTVDLSAGLSITIPANSFSILLLNKAKNYLSGTVTVTASVDGVVSACVVK